MSPPVMAQDIDSQRYRLEKEVRVKVLVPEHEEQEEGIQIAYPEIIFTVAAGKEYACKTDHGCEQINKKDRSVSPYREQSVVYKVHC